MRDERILHDLGARQHGLATWWQLLDAGFTRHEVQHLVAIGRLIRVHRAVYRLAGAPITWPQSLLAGVLATDGAASHRAATASWGVDLPGPPAPVEVTVPRTRAPRPPGVIVHRSNDLTSRDIVRRNGIPTTNPLRTLVDLGTVVGHDDVEYALDSLTSRRIVTVAGVRRYQERAAGPGRRGALVLGQVLDRRALGDQTADGMLEPAMARLCEASGLPTPEFQVRIVVAGTRRRMDFAYPAERLDIEVDGYEEHGGKYRKWEDDEFRDAELTAAGWQVVRFSWFAVRRRPEWVARTLARILVERRTLLGLPA